MAPLPWSPWPRRLKAEPGNAAAAPEAAGGEVRPTFATGGPWPRAAGDRARLLLANGAAAAAAELAGLAGPGEAKA